MQSCEKVLETKTDANGAKPKERQPQCCSNQKRRRQIKRKKQRGKVLKAVSNQKRRNAKQTPMPQTSQTLTETATGFTLSATKSQRSEGGAEGVVTSFSLQFFAKIEKKRGEIPVPNVSWQKVGATGIEKVSKTVQNRNIQCKIRK